MVVLGGGTLWPLQKFLQCIKYILLEFIPSTSLLYSPLPIPGIVSKGITFAFISMCTQCLHHIHPPNPFPCHLPLLLVPVLPRQDLFCTPVLWFCRKKKKKWHFCLFEIKVATQGASLWYFHVYMYYNPNWFIYLFPILFFFILPLSLSYGGFNQFKISIFILV
jgi:hypothetical protein